jgi:hypothetical protein
MHQGPWCKRCQTQIDKRMQKHQNRDLDISGPLTVNTNHSDRFGIFEGIISGWDLQVGKEEEQLALFDETYES